MADNINLSFFENFFSSPSPADYAKELINTKNLDENKEIVAEIKKQDIRFKGRNKRNERKKKSAGETLKIIEEIHDYNKGTQKTFAHASKVDKGKSEPKPEESIARRIKLRRERVAEIEAEKKNQWIV